MSSIPQLLLPTQCTKPFVALLNIKVHLRFSRESSKSDCPSRSKVLGTVSALRLRFRMEKWI
jgi:hypothetical protein